MGLAPDTFIERVRGGLGETFTTNQRQFGGRPVVLAQRSDFRWRWFASRLDTTMTLTAFDADVSTETLENYLHAAVRTAAGGRHRGLQRGVAALAVAVLPATSEEANKWAARSHGHKFAAIAYPVVVDLASGTITRPTTMRLGRVFQTFLRGLTDDVLAAHLADH